jgi:cation:H+ antiporter
MASVQGNSEIAVGNILGSNIANILLILGISALIHPLPIQRNTILSEIPFSLAATFLMGFLANAVLFGDKTTLEISRPDGAILLIFFFLFMSYIVYLARTGAQDPTEDLPAESLSIPKAVIFNILGIVLLFGGGKLVVDSAVQLATIWGLSQAFIGLTIVAIGTSLPELVTSAVAAWKRNADIAVGNVVGSNIFNLLWILGISALIRPLPFSPQSNLDILVLIVANALLIFVLPLGRRWAIDRMNGGLFVGLYLAYIAYLVQRG